MHVEGEGGLQIGGLPACVDEGVDACGRSLARDGLLLGVEAPLLRREEGGGPAFGDPFCLRARPRPSLLGIVREVGRAGGQLVGR